MRKFFWSKIVLVENFLLLKNHFLENRFARKTFWDNFLLENSFLLQNHFLDNRFARKKKLGKIVLVEKYFGRNFFCWTFFIVAKSFLRKQVWKKKSENFLVENFILLPNNILENKSAKRFSFEKLFWEYVHGRKFFIVAN